MLRPAKVLACGCVWSDSTPVPRQNPREIAAKVLRKWENAPVSAESLLQDMLHDLVGNNRNLCLELVLGVIRHRAWLDWLIEKKTEGRRQAQLVQILLRLGLYQIFQLDRIPGHAAVNETVAIAKNHDLTSQSRFINAVLRACLREKNTWLEQLATLKENDPSIGYSHPPWLVRRWADRLENYIDLLKWNNLPAKIYARRNSLRTTAEELEAQWRNEGVAFETVELSWIKTGIIYRIENSGSPALLPSFLEGKFYIQDPSTLAAVQELDPQPKENILDLCAAPGGKTTAIAQRMQDEGAILALDIDPSRLKRLRENSIRLGLNCIQPRALHQVDLKRAGPFDRILIDAPCSNTGVMRRRVDVRWRLNARELPVLADTQLDLLNRAAPLLKPAGLMVYSTCSLETEENEGVIERFLQKHRLFKQVSCRNITPMKDGVDGAFVARLQRNKNS